MGSMHRNSANDWKDGGIIVRRSALVLAVAATALVSLTGCTSSTPGTATPSGEPTAGSSPSMSTQPSKPTKSTSQPADSPLADRSPCDLLTASAASALKVKDSGSEEKIGRGRACLWTIPAESSRDRASLTISIFDTLGVKDIVAKGEIKTIANVGKHEARQYVGTAGNCVFSIAVSATTRVDVLSSSLNFEKSCVIAEEAAKLVEPELP